MTIYLDINVTSKRNNYKGIVKTLAYKTIIT